MHHRIAWAAYKARGVDTNSRSEYHRRGVLGYYLLGNEAPPPYKGPSSRTFYDRLTPLAQLGAAEVESHEDADYVFVMPSSGGNCGVHPVRVRPMGDAGGFPQTWELHALQVYPRMRRHPLDQNGRVFVAPYWGEARGVKLSIGRMPIACALPGVAHLMLPDTALFHIVEAGERHGAELVMSAVSRACNAAKRAGNRRGVEAFFQAQQQEAQALPSDWSGANQRRQRLYGDVSMALSANVRRWETLRREAHERMMKLERLSMDWLDDYQALVDEGVIESVKAVPQGVYILLKPIRIRCDPGRFKVARDPSSGTWPGGLYEQPPALLWIPNSGPGDMRILNPVTGESHQHPPVAQGPGRNGSPCWGETDAIRRRNEAWCKDLWFSDPRGFINFILGYMANIYDEGAETRYPPFQSWCKRISD